MYDCYKTPDEDSCFDFASEYNDFWRDDDVSIFGNSTFKHFVTDEARDILTEFCDWQIGGYADSDDAATLAQVLTERHGEQFFAYEIHGCVQGEWQHIVMPARLRDAKGTLEQQYFNLVQEWHCVPWNGDMERGFFGFVYPFNEESTEEQLRDMCDGDEVALHYPRTVLVWS